MKADQNALRKLQEIVASEPSEWLEQAEYRSKNRKWLRRSQAVAVKILRTLRERKMTQKELAVSLGVSPQLVNKWVKGGENFTFETIAKLEAGLGVELMAINGMSSVAISYSKIVFVSTEIQVLPPASQEFIESFSECKVIDICNNNDWITQDRRTVAG